MQRDTLSAKYFDDLYEGSDDPWQFTTSSYEAEKYARTLAMLPAREYAHALEIGCSIGVLTQKLAARCARLCSIDISERALALAAERCSHLDHVRFERRAFPAEIPEGQFDLVIVSEVGYYWSDEDLSRARDAIATLAPGATLELVHFLPKVDDYVRDGDGVHEAFLADSRFTSRSAMRAPRYRIDLLAIA